MNSSQQSFHDRLARLERDHADKGVHASHSGADAREAQQLRDRTNARRSRSRGGFEPTLTLVTALTLLSIVSLLFFALPPDRAKAALTTYVSEAEAHLKEDPFTLQDAAGWTERLDAKLATRKQAREPARPSKAERKRAEFEKTKAEMSAAFLARTVEIGQPELGRRIVEAFDTCDKELCLYRVAQDILAASMGQKTATMLR